MGLGVLNDSTPLSCRTGRKQPTWCKAVECDRGKKKIVRRFPSLTMETSAWSPGTMPVAPGTASSEHARRKRRLQRTPQIIFSKCFQHLSHMPRVLRSNRRWRLVSQIPQNVVTDILNGMTDNMNLTCMLSKNHLPSLTMGRGRYSPGTKPVVPDRLTRAREAKESSEQCGGSRVIKNASPRISFFESVQLLRTLLEGLRGAGSFVFKMT